MTTTTKPAPCWTLTRPDGAEIDTGDGSPCYVNREAAAKGADHFRVERGESVPRERERPCVTLACGCCGEDLGYEEDNRSYHFATLEEARECAKAWGWTIDGEALCEPCGPKGDCDCREDRAALTARSAS